MSHSRSASTQRLQWWGHTDRGKVRKNNEDSFLALQFDSLETNYLGKIGESALGRHDFVFAVSDGMGGAKAGEFASKISVDKITRLLPRSYKLGVLGLHENFPDVLAELFDEIHKGLCYYGSCYTECSGMGATLSLAWFVPGWMYFAHIGDSRIYYVPAAGTGMKQLTEDDTHVGWLFRQGQINEREARSHPRKNALQKALGAGHQFVSPQVGAVGCEPGDLFLLCTDGVVDGLYDSSLHDFLRSPQPGGTNVAQVLVNEAVTASGRDNTTALLVRVT
jgi:serine/threonine protein phosphatase PrpC